MGTIEFPLVISPNLGCPKIISLEDIVQGEATLDIILAEQYGELIHPTKEMFKDVFKLVPSYEDEMQEEICLDVSTVTEITDWNRLFDFSNPEETQRLVNSEVHYNVLGEVTKYLLIKAAPRNDTKKSARETFLRKGEKGKYVPKLYDLAYLDRPENKKINYHAVQFVETCKKGFNFIHLTDLHIAQRNDEILAEVLKRDNNKGMGGRIEILLSRIFSKYKKEGIRGRDAIINSYKNFNDNLRKFIHVANELANQGELDFIIITGDIVDFAGLGWDETVSDSENNWKVFLDIVTGQGMERSRSFHMHSSSEKESNPGIKVAIFTSTGNHDWRLHPYSLLPYYGEHGEFEKFGLTKEEAKIYKYKSFDSSEYPDDVRKKRSDALTQEALKRLNLDATSDGRQIKLFKTLEGVRNYLISGLIAVGGVTGISGQFIGILSFFKTSIGQGISILVGAAAPLGVFLLHRKVQKYADILIDNPIHAEVKALHYYFTHINPYFDYAFSFGTNTFILMDTGADVLTVAINELIDGKEVEDLKRVVFKDNILGSSPDSMAFDDRQSFYNWQQIVWLDKVLSGISNESGRIFMCVHAPPVNYDPRCKDKLKIESKTNEFISEKDCYLTYGTINHYLSQFFFLCQGLRENPQRRIDPHAPSSLKRLDLVLSGHTHINAEFRLGIEYDADTKENKVRIYYDRYSEDPSICDPKKFDEKKPFIVQTAACGPQSDKDNYPPYWRLVKIDAENRISSFKHENMDD